MSTMSAVVNKFIETDTKGPFTAITTHSGIVFDLANPDTWVFSLEDIAHSLSNLCRYNGHSQFYSVAEHSIRVSERVGGNGDPLTSLLGLMHDATEAYLGDVPRPQKKMMSIDGEPFEDFEMSMAYMLFGAYGLLDDHFDDRWGLVKKADSAVYEEERAQRPYVSGKAVGMQPFVAKDAFISHYAALNRELIGPIRP